MKTLHLRSILSKSIRYTENYNAFSQYWLTERAQFSKTITDCTSHNQHLKRWRNWATKFCLICHIHLTFHHQPPLLQASQQLFAGKTLPRPAGCKKKKKSFLMFTESQSMDFYVTGINKHFSLAKMC